MIRRTLLLAAASLACAGQPLAGQEPAGDEQALAQMMALFQVEPLTAEQQARLPAARAVVAKIMPPGTMAEVMGGMFDGFLGPMMEMAVEPSPEAVAEELGFDADSLALTEEEAARVATIIDPVWSERRKRELAGMQELMARVMTAMEPAMRQGMAEAYAVHFTDGELADIGAFFSTPSGASFARKSYAMTSDPRIMTAAMQTMPAMMQSFATIEADLAAATADLPPRRGFEDLSPEERRTLAELTGLDPEAIEEGMAAAAEQREAGSLLDTEG